MSRASAPLVISEPGRSMPPAQNTPAGAQARYAETPMFRLDLRRSLEMHRNLALGFILVGIVLGAAYLYLHWPIYTAETLVYIQPTPAAPLSGVGMHWPYNYDPATYESYIQQQILSMTRPDVLKDAVAKLNDGWRKNGESDGEAVARLESSVDVERVQNSYQVSITASSTNAQTAADMANAVAKAYIASTSSEQRAGDAQRMTILRDERDRVQKELASDRAEQAMLTAQLGVSTVGPGTPNTYDNDIEAIHAELVKARSDHDQAEAQLTALNGNNAAALNAAADQIVAADPGLNSLKMSLDARRATLVSQMANLKPNHPLYKQDAEELAKINANLQSATGEARAKAVTQVQQKLQANLASAAAVEDQLNSELNQMTRAATGATPKLQRAADLVSDIARLQARYNALDDQVQNQMIEDESPERAHITNLATAPLRPSEHGAIRNAGVIMTGFILMGLMAAVLAHKLDPHVYIASDVEQVLGFAPMTILPDFREVSEGVAEEHLLRLSSSLEHARRHGALSTCIFTGTGPGTGTSTIATRVRSFLEGMGKTAALVDAAAALPHESPEMSDAPRGSRSVALLQSMTEPAAEAESMVLTDTAPLSLSAETEYLARNADCAVVVMQSGVTTRAELRTTAAVLERLNVGTVGFVLNRVRMAKADKAFCTSVRAVEQHLRSRQRLAIADQPVRTRRVDAEQARAPKMPSREPQMSMPAPLPPIEAPEVQPAPAPPVMAGRRSPRPEPGPPPVQPSTAPEAPPPVQAMPELPQAAEPTMPWWLADPILQAQKPPLPVMRGRESQTPPPLTTKPLEETLTPGPHEEKIAATESRLSGLRNIFRIAETMPQSPQPAAVPPVGEAYIACPPAPPAHPVYTEPEPRPPAPAEPLLRYRGEAFVPFPEVDFEPAPPAPVAGATRQVTTVPEFLPPRKSRWDTENKRMERQETVDDVAVLPSWRGQYRRKD